MSTQPSESELRPRGTEVMLPHGGLPEVFSPYLRNLIESTGGPTGPIGLQFVAQPEREQAGWEGEASDPLLEDAHEAAPGLVYKYQAGATEKGVRFSGRALWTITRNCAAYCRFCTRGREVGIPAGQEGIRSSALSFASHLSRDQIEQTLSFIRNEPGLKEIILSGGDPLTVRPDVLHYVLGELARLQKSGNQESGKLDVVRIGTRVPIQNPAGVKEAHYRAIQQLQAPRMMIHINHPAELTSESLHVLDRFRKDTSAIVMSQTVLLKGVNDTVDVLYALFTAMAREGIVPYYVYQNDPVYWAKHFTVPVGEAIALWQNLRPMLSGVAATARFVIDTPGGYGKIPVPEGDAWNFDTGNFRDFQGKTFPLDVTD